MVEQLLVDTEVAALLMVRCDGVELVEAHYGNVLETYLAFFVALHQFAVETERGAAGREAQHEGLCALVIVDGFNNLVSYVLNTFVFCLENVSGDFLVAADDVAGNVGGNESAILGECVLTFHIVLFLRLKILTSKIRKRCGYAMGFSLKN